MCADPNGGSRKAAFRLDSGVTGVPVMPSVSTGVGMKSKVSPVSPSMSIKLTPEDCCMVWTEEDTMWIRERGVRFFGATWCEVAGVSHVQVYGCHLVPKWLLWARA